MSLAPDIQVSVVPTQDINIVIEPGPTPTVSIAPTDIPLVTVAATGPPGPQGIQGIQGPPGTTVPTGAAGGDLSGSYPNPNVIKSIGNFAVGGQLSVPTNGVAAGLLLGSDTNLYRAALNTIKTDDTLVAAGNLTAQQAASFQVVMGNVGLGSGSGLTFGSASDTNLYRAAASALKTDGHLQAGLSVRAMGGSLYTYAGVYFGPTDDASIVRLAAKALQTDGQFRIETAAPGDVAFVARVAGEANNRWYITTLGAMSWGAGGASAPDTNLYRAGADALKTDGTFIVGGSFNLAGTFMNLLATGVINWGADVNLYRPSPNILKTDDYFQAAGVMSNAGVGAVAFSAPDGYADLRRSVAGGAVLVARAVANAADAFTIDTAGRISWGGGTTAADTNLFRSAADTLRTNDAFIADVSVSAPLVNATGSGFDAIRNSGLTVFRGRVTADPDYRFMIDANGMLMWGDGATSGARDVNLYRAAADVLATDDRFRIFRAASAVQYLDLWGGDSAGGYLIARSTEQAKKLLNFQAVHDSGGTPSGTLGFVWATGPSSAPVTRMSLSEAGLLTLSTTGVTGGLVIGDTNLYRESADTLKTDDMFVIGSGKSFVKRDASGLFLGSYGNAGDANPLFSIESALPNRLLWGTGGATAPDVNLYRYSTDILATDDSMRVGGALAVPNARVTVLPTSPIDGQECYFAADSTNGVVWHLRYNAGSASAYKWEVIGGSPLVADVYVSQSCAGDGVTRDLTTVGPSITFPLAGDYLVNETAGASNSGGAATAVTVQMTDLANATFSAPGDWFAQAYMAGSANERRRLTSYMLLTARAAGSGVKMRYAASASASSFAQRELMAMPVRVG